MSLISEKTPLGVRIATTVGITASAYLFGNNLALSYAAIPTVLKAPAPLAADQWSKVYETGKSIGPPLAIVSALATAFVAYHQDPSSLPFKLNVAATILVPSIVPFTIFFIKPTNDKLYQKRDSLASSSLTDKAVEAGVAEGETVHALIDRWGVLNAWRALLVGAGSLLAAWAAVDKLEAAAFADAALRSGANRLG